MYIDTLVNPLSRKIFSSDHVNLLVTQLCWLHLSLLEIELWL